MIIGFHFGRSAALVASDAVGALLPRRWPRRRLRAGCSASVEGRLVARCHPTAVPRRGARRRAGRRCTPPAISTTQGAPGSGPQPRLHRFRRSSTARHRCGDRFFRARTMTLLTDRRSIQTSSLTRFGDAPTTRPAAGPHLLAAATYRSTARELGFEEIGRTGCGSCGAYPLGSGRPLWCCRAPG
jgi:hypothetical protein